MQFLRLSVVRGVFSLCLRIVLLYWLVGYLCLDCEMLVGIEKGSGFFQCVSRMVKGRFLIRQVVLLWFRDCCQLEVLKLFMINRLVLFWFEFLINVWVMFFFDSLIDWVVDLMLCSLRQLDRFVSWLVVLLFVLVWVMVMCLVFCRNGIELIVVCMVLSELFQVMMILLKCLLVWLLSGKIRIG